MEVKTSRHLGNGTLHGHTSEKSCFLTKTKTSKNLFLPPLEQDSIRVNIINDLIYSKN